MWVELVANEKYCQFRVDTRQTLLFHNNSRYLMAGKVALMIFTVEKIPFAS